MILSGRYYKLSYFFHWKKKKKKQKTNVFLLKNELYVYIGRNVYERDY